jgi:hypothetical protein
LASGIFAQGRRTVLFSHKLSCTLAYHNPQFQHGVVANENANPSCIQNFHHSQLVGSSLKNLAAQQHIPYDFLEP